ncbi:carboxypeptidase regulatory-like domain-containing protein [Corallococcus sp. CA047B]|uniref:carboxypeptidase-like regulatory domain-containing protein n=1 Tax=Corallococcus sp. CA047B TaxID=2316729 RepID=UPI000EA407A9|nr:carboxypeptidase-like regulatory domain-containing protein [Corallococcus sp. CA047B]RKH11502.1 carboxypeptidase regulatory-like domain-containing protein [Corallococcus sp. CA047B]
MRKWVFIGVAAVLVALAAVVLGPRWGAPAVRPASPVSASSMRQGLPAFKAVAVSSGAQEGLTLTGRVLDGGGRPVADAEVSLAASAERTVADVRCDECGLALLACTAHETALHTRAFFEQQQGFLTPRATVRTDAQGKFRFEHLVGVSFSVWARAEGLGVALRNRAAPGEPVDLYLPALRSISGTVVDDSGQPRPGARVRAVSRKVPLPFEVVAGAGGAFLLTGLGEGPFYVLADAEGFQPAVAQQVEADSQPLRLKLTPSRTLEVRVTRDGAPAVATVRLRGDHLTREAHTEAQGAPVRFNGLYPDEVVVTAEAPGFGSAPQTLTLSKRVTQVTLELEAAGRLLVTVVDEEGQPVPNPQLLLRTVAGDLIRRDAVPTGALAELGPLAPGEYVLEGQAEGFKTAQLPARVAQGETALELELAKATLITGQVIDEYGRPASNVSILVQPTGETTNADNDGRFSAQVPMPGLYTLHAHHSEWGGGSVQATAPATDVTLSLEAKAGVDVTVSSGGRRVEGADVVMWADPENIFRSDRPSGPDGVVPMRGLPPGTYTLMASHPEYVASGPTAVTVQDGATQQVAVTLEPGASLAGDVVDEDGQPVVGANLNVMPRMAEPTQTDSSGRFEFRALRPDRTYLLDAHHAGYEPLERTQGKPGGPPVQVKMRKRTTFRGRVMDDAGQPVRRFRVDDHDVNSPDGRFELPLSTAGDRLIVAVDAAGYEPQVVDRPSKTTDMGDVVLTKAPAVSGMVRDASGGAVPDAVVTCDVCDGSVLSGPDGAFTLSSPPFVPRFTVSARKGKLSGTQEVPRGSTTPVQLTLKTATRLTGRVYLADGRPAAGSQVEGLNADRSETVSLITGADGRYSTDLSPGSYRFVVGGGRGGTGEPAVVVQVAGTEMTLDLGPVPGTASLTVLLQPERGKALWVVPGEVGQVGNPPAELLRSRFAQLVYQPMSERVVVQGLTPGRYTLVWGFFHAEMPGAGPLVRTVDVPSQGDVSLR